MRRGILIFVLSTLLFSLLCGCSSEVSDDNGSASVPPSGGTVVSSERQPPAEDTPSPGQSAGPLETEEMQPKEPLLWQQDMMGELPDPGCEVVAVTKEGTRVHVVLEGTSGESVKEYRRSLLELGYTTQAEGEGDNGEIMCSVSKDGESVVLLYEPDGGNPPGSGLLQITRETK